MNDAEIKVKFPELAFDKKDVQIKLNNRKGLLNMINKDNPNYQALDNRTKDTKCGSEESISSI